MKFKIFLLGLFMSLSITAQNESEALRANQSGVDNLNKKEYIDAILDFDEAISLNSKLASAYGNRGLAKYYIEDYEGAIEDYNRSIKLNPGEASVYNNRAFAKYKIANIEGAIEDFGKAIRVNPDDITALSNRAKQYVGIEEYEKAIKDYDKAILVEPKNKNLFYARGVAKYQNNNTNGACDDFKKAQDLGHQLVAQQIAELCQ